MLLECSPEIQVCVREQATVKKGLVSYMHKLNIIYLIAALNIA